MADRDLNVRLKADDQITPAARKAADSLEEIEKKGDVKVKVEATGLEKLSKDLDGMPGQIGDVGDALGNLAGGGAGATALGVGAIATAMFAAANSAKDLALEAQTTADLTGSTVEDASKLQSLWKTTGADVNDLNDVLLQMNGALAQSPELAAQLGINLNDGRSITERFVELSDKLASGQMSAVQASQLFGEEGVRQVGKLRTVYGGLSDDLEGMPAPVDADDVAKALEMERAMNELKTTVASVATVIGQDLIPLFTEVTTLANNLADALPGDVGGAKGLADAYRDWGTGLGLIEKGAGALNSVLGDQDEITAHLADNFAEASAATDDAATSAAFYSDAQNIINDSISESLTLLQEQRVALQEMSDARRAAAADSTFAARDAERDFADQLAAANEIIADPESTLGDWAKAMDETAQSAGRSADSQKQLQKDAMAAMGVTQSAEDAQTTWNTSMLGSARTAEGPLRDSIVNYIATVNGIPPEKVSEILANPDYDTIEEATTALDDAAAAREAELLGVARDEQAERDLNHTARDRDSNINVKANLIGSAWNTLFRTTGTAAASSSALVPAGRGVAPMAATPVVVHAPLPTPSLTFNIGVMGNRYDIQRNVAQALRQYERRNGQRR